MEDNPGREIFQALMAAPEEDRDHALQATDAPDLDRWNDDWPTWVREGQEPPEGEGWRVWVMLAGRGFGKTRAGAEWISGLARANPEARLALVAASIDEARRVMIEGRSGLIAVARRGERERMLWEPSRRRLKFASGAEAYLYSGGRGDSLRGPEHHFAWCDELAKWGQAQEAWNNLMLGLRLGEAPKALVTTTPKPVETLKAIMREEGAVRTGGPTAANPYLPERFVAVMERQHKGTRLGRQELGGELIEDVEGALWPRKLIDSCRESGGTWRQFSRVVIGVDPPAGIGGDACGIVAVGLDDEGIGYVLGDHSVHGLSPDGWARKVAAAAEMQCAVKVVAEANNGGAMVESVLRAAGIALPVKLVHAAEGKTARAAPVAALFESKRARFWGRFPELEDELAGLSWEGRYEGPGRSPDRADAMVWALTELMLGKARREPRVSLL
jgi:phage terminase large subunit-like protein